MKILLLLLPFVFLSVSDAVAAPGDKIESRQVRLKSKAPIKPSGKQKTKSKTFQSVSIPLTKSSNQSRPDDSSPEKQRSANSLWVTLTSLGLVLILIVLGAFLWNKHGPQVKNGLPVEAFQLLGKRVVDQRNSIFFFRTGSKILVVSSGVDGMRILSEITEPVEVDYLTGVCNPISDESPKRSVFRAGLDKTVGQNTSLQENPSDHQYGDSAQENTFSPYQQG